MTSGQLLNVISNADFYVFKLWHYFSTRYFMYVKNNEIVLLISNIIFLL